jgi:3-methylfumaryl-CoA hydratase
MADAPERTEILDPVPALALGDLLGVPVPDLAGGAGLPPLWHWVYLLERAPVADLGPDGHPVRGTLPVPPGPGLRRMWAGGRVRTRGPLRCGEPATKRSRVLSVTEKDGRSGRLTFVTAGHQVLQRGEVVIDEEQDIVYREAAATPPPGPPGPLTAGPEVPAGAGEREIEISPVVLFRFSALTYNAHRIHYDRDFCRNVEGYPGLLTHGPLQAIAMAEAARAAAGTGTGDVSFSYRLVAPLFDNQGLFVSAAAAPDGTTVTAARDRYGRQTATGTLSRAGAERQLLLSSGYPAAGGRVRARPASLARRTASCASAVIARSSTAGRSSVVSASSASPRRTRSSS